MFCKKCGKEISEGTRFCKYCGTPVDGAAGGNAATPSGDMDAASLKTPIIIGVLIGLVILLGTGGIMFAVGAGPFSRSETAYEEREREEEDIDKEEDEDTDQEDTDKEDTDSDTEDRDEADDDDFDDKDLDDIDEEDASSSKTDPNSDENQTTQNKTNANSSKKKSNSVYLLPDSSGYTVTSQDLAGLSARELTYARNEIYARHGAIFESDELNAYFATKDWYDARQPVSETPLSKLEQDNAGYILEYQQNNNLTYKPD